MSRFEELKSNYEYRKSQLREDKKLEMFAVTHISSYMTHMRIHKITCYKYCNENIQPTISFKVRWSDGCYNDLVEYYEPRRGIPCVFREVDDYPEYQDVEFELVEVPWGDNG